MRTRLFIILIYIASCKGRTSDFDNRYRHCDDFPQLDSLVVRTDTIGDYKTMSDQVLNYYDAKDRLLKTVSCNVFESNSENIHFLTNYYDTAGHIIHENKIEGHSKWYCCIYKYDEKGRLILKDSYNFGKPALYNQLWNAIIDHDTFFRLLYQADVFQIPAHCHALTSVALMSKVY